MICGAAGHLPGQNPTSPVSSGASSVHYPSHEAEGRGAFTTYSSDQGLPINFVYCSFFDHYGNIWFGTQGGGVCRYDGKTFVTYTMAQGLASNSVWDIKEDKDGNIWFCTGGGVCKYDGKCIVSYTDNKRKTNVWCITPDDKGNMWWGTAGIGAVKYNGKYVTYTSEDGLTANSIRSILKDSKGNIWFGTRENGVSKYDGSTFTSYTKKDGLADDYVKSILEDKEGNLWFATKNGGISKFNGKTFVNFTTANGLPANSIRCLYQDKAGAIWIGTEGKGVCKFDGKSFLTYTTTQGLADNYVCTIAEDRQGNLWFGTEDGVSKYEGTAFVNYTIAQGMANSNVWSIAEDKKGNLWLSTNKGISCFDGHGFKNYVPPGASNPVQCIATDKDGNIWMGLYEDGAYRYDGKQFVKFTVNDGLPNSVRCIYQDKSGTLWLTTDGGASRYNGKTFTTYTTAQGLTNNIVYDMLQDQSGKWWFATNNGISVFDGNSFKNFSMQQGMVNNTVYRIIEDRYGRLWLGTQQGMSCMVRPGSDHEPQFKNYTIENGLPDNFVTQIMEMPDGKMAVGTNMGIALFDYPDFKEDNLKNIEVFNTEQGYPVKDVNAGHNAMYKDSKGIVWVGTGTERTGLVRFDYTAIVRNVNKPTAVIQNINIQEEHIPWEYLLEKRTAGRRPSAADPTTCLKDSLSMVLSEFYAFGKSVSETELDDQLNRFADVQLDSVDRFYPLPRKLVLPYHHNQISFEFASIDPSRGFMMNYQYILEGYSKDWSPVTSQTSAIFGNIYEGTYIFKVRARNPQGIWSSPVTYTFKVLPPWWRTWWMYAIYAGLAVLLVVLTTWLNTLRLRAKARELTKTVNDATAVIREQKKMVEEQKYFVEEKNKHITDSINYAQRIQNAILPENDYIKALFPHYFIYYQPKEIVSGDFYWFGQKDDKIIFAVADCTGHGVPGALMSMIGNTLLNEIINSKGITDAAEILNHLKKDIIHVLKQKDALESQKDGMDIALCVLSEDRKTLVFAGAHNSLYHFSNGELKEIRGDQQAIGYTKGQLEPFTKHTIRVQEGDSLYLFTDGFADQKGQLTKKKFYYPPFRQLLTTIHNKPILQQGEILRTTFNEWKGNLDQIDDVLIVGIQL